MARQFGLGQLFDIGIPGQKPGLVPDTAWKRRDLPARIPVWHPGETPSMGIGQGYVNVNPLQLCVQAARLANGDKALNPRLIAVDRRRRCSPPAPLAPDLPFAQEHIDFVRDAMAAVTEASGTAAAAAPTWASGRSRWPARPAPPSRTATAAATARTARRAPGTLRDHAWFIAFAPADDPRYAMSVLVEHGGFGAEAAAPKAREIMRVALLKDPEVRARIDQPSRCPSAGSRRRPTADVARRRHRRPTPDAAT